MKKFFLLVPIVLLIAMAVTAFGFMKNGVVSASGAELHFVEHTTAIKQITVGTATDLRGNYIVFDDPVFDAADKHQVGNVNGTCVNTSNTMEECHFTFILPKGQITVEGPFTSASPTATFAITGGTGIYDEARGQVAQKTVNTPAGTEIDFAFDVD